jgi:type VI secretion system protein ImpC
MATNANPDPVQQPVVQATQASASLLEEIVKEGRLGQTPEEQVKGKDWLRSLVEQVTRGKIAVSKDMEQTINDRIRQLDEVISLQLNEILHDPEFQHLEGAWRGLYYLVDQSETSASLKIELMNVSKKDLLNDLTKATEFDQSETFKKVYEEEFGTLGGQPIGALIGDYEFGRTPQDVTLLEKMSNVAAAAHAPFVAAASPSLFNLQEFTALGGPRDLEKIFQSDAFLDWNEFRKQEDSKYVGLCLPHVLMRLPYGPNTIPIEEFEYDEKVDGKDHSKYLWGNAAYAFATRLTDAFARNEWCAAIRGVEGGGKVEGLPTHVFTTDEGDVATKCPTEIAITDRRENELSKLGFIPLCYYKGTKDAVFFGAQSANKAKQYINPDANANARLSAQLQYMFAVSRFAHFLKVMMRDKIGSFTTKDECQSFLNNWISQYVLLDDTASQANKAQFPLREARIEVSEVAGKPGVYNAVAFLRPHFQLDELTISMRLVARLPESKGKG